MASRADCVVIGGGVIGLAVARRLSRNAGANVVLVERFECGREASWAGAGILAPCNPHRNDPIFHLHERSLSAYPTFCAELLEESAIDPEYDRAGALELLLTEQAVQLARSDVRAAANQRMSDGQSTLELISADEAVALESVLSRDTLGATHCRQTAIVRNPRLLQALRTSCERGGVRILEHSPARGLLWHGARVAGVELDGEQVTAEHVILCAGTWSSQLDPRLATLMPVHPVRGQMVLMKLAERHCTHVISRGKTYLVPRRDGHVLLGSTEEPEAGFEKRSPPRAIEMLIENGIRLVPMLADAPVVATWSGLRPGTTDDKPYLGHVPTMPGLIAATGHFRAGLTLAPVTAEFVESLINDRCYDLDLTCCSPGRARMN